MTPGLKLIASTRPVFSVGEETLTFTLPVDEAGEQLARKGDILAMVIVSDATETGFVAPTGWTSADSIGATEAKLDMLVRGVEQDEPTSITVELTGVTKERQGQLLLFRGGAPNFFRESSTSATFAAAMDPAAPAGASLQAVNLALAVWSSSGAVFMQAPDGYTEIDTYSSNIATSRSALFAIATVNTTGAFTPPAASSNANATGRAFVQVLRDRLPYQPPYLDDPVPGNIAFFGKDTRLGR